MNTIYIRVFYYLFREPYVPLPYRLASLYGINPVVVTICYQILKPFMLAAQNEEGVDLLVDLHDDRPNGLLLVENMTNMHRLNATCLRLHICAIDFCGDYCSIMIFQFNFLIIS